MQVKLTSQQYKILDYGTVFLFDENADLTIPERRALIQKFQKIVLN